MASIESRLASSMGRPDEEPNQELAAELAENDDVAGIAEIVGLLASGTSVVQSDAIKVLYEVGHLEPELIAPYVRVFLDLLESKQTRLMWGAMTALSTIAGREADTIMPYLDRVRNAMNRGSVIAVDHGVSVLAGVAASSLARSREIFPHLLQHLQGCRAKEVPQHAERMLVAVNGGNVQRFSAVLQARLPELSPAQAKRVRRVVQDAATH